MLDEIGDISKLGRRYLDGQLRGSQLSGEFQLSQATDINTLDSLDEPRRERWLELGRDKLPGRVAFGVLAAGASSRMALKDMPAVCRKMLEATHLDDVPASKALVPVYLDESSDAPRVLTFLDLFLQNVKQLRSRHGIDNPAVLLSSEANGDEINGHLQATGADNMLVFRQPLAPQIAATPDDVEHAKKNFKSEADLAQARERAAVWAGHEVMIGKPAGHGEFLHQLVASGLLTQLDEQGIEYLSVRNIDNAAAVLNDDWLTLLGYAVEAELDCLLEVCPRLPGQKGGALIQQNGQWRIAEDPSFRGTQHTATESCYINNAVALFRLDYFYKLYEVTPAELHNATAEQLQAIADRGRARFPVIVEAKPVQLKDGSVIAAITPETNMWESTSVVEEAKIGAFGVPSERAVGEDFLDIAPAEQSQRARRVRFSPTKTWADFEDPVKSKILEQVARGVLGDSHSQG